MRNIPVLLIGMHQEKDNTEGQAIKQWGGEKWTRRLGKRNRF